MLCCLNNSFHVCAHNFVKRSIKLRQSASPALYTSFCRISSLSAIKHELFSFAIIVLNAFFQVGREMISNSDDSVLQQDMPQALAKVEGAANLLVEASKLSQRDPTSKVARTKLIEGSRFGHFSVGCKITICGTFHSPGGSCRAHPTCYSCSTSLKFARSSPSARRFSTIYPWQRSLRPWTTWSSLSEISPPV
jgi:hypothetical protein